jgi:hypothetical protein
VRLVASPPVSARPDRRKAPGSVKARRPTPHRGDSAPQAPAAATKTQGTTAPTAATAPAAASAPAVESPAAVAAREVVAAVKGVPALPAAVVSLPIQVRALPSAAVSEVVASAVAHTTKALPVASPVLP